MHDLAIWGLCAVAIVGILARPLGIGEWVWVSIAAAVVAIARLLPLREIVRAITTGSDVYAFLVGMMLLAEVARREGVFDWLAGLAVRAAGGSRGRLFLIVYGVGIVVTAVLSNDATAVVLTPAVAASVRAAKADPLPYLFACALIANAASFVLPISNPANLVVFAGTMPPLTAWLATFALPSLAAVGVTYVVLRAIFRKELSGNVNRGAPIAPLDRGGRIALIGIGLTSLALVLASALGKGLGLATLVCAALVFCAIAVIDRSAAASAVRNVSWTVIVLVAGLFVLVAAAERTGLLNVTSLAARTAIGWPAPLGYAASGFAAALGSNLINNLPAGLIAGSTAASVQAPGGMRAAIAIGIDLGPNLSVTGSLATILWLLVLRRENIHVGAWRFLRVGIAVMPAALLSALEMLLVRR